MQFLLEVLAPALRPPPMKEPPADLEFPENFSWEFQNEDPLTFDQFSMAGGGGGGGGGQAPPDHNGGPPRGMPPGMAPPGMGPPGMAGAVSDSVVRLASRARQWVCVTDSLT